MFTFIPENLNLQSVLESNPPKFKYHVDYFHFLLGQITSVAAIHKDLVDEQGYVPLHAPLLKLRVHNYKQYMRYLIENGIIECNGKYVPGDRSKGYRFTASYGNSPIVMVAITKRTLIKSIRSKDNWMRNMQAKYDFLNRWFDDKLSIDYDAAMKKNEELKQEDLRTGNANAYLRFNASQANIFRIKERDYTFHCDYTAGRIHTNLTALKKELRPYVKYDGKVLASLDVVASQPFLIGNLLLSPGFIERGSRDTITYYSLWASIREALDLAEIRKQYDSLGNDAILFMEDCSQDFYTAFLNRIKLSGTEMYLDRDTVKQATYLILYSKNGYFSQEGALFKRIFKAIYPTVYSLLETYKIRTHKALPVLLQHIEAQVMLSGVARSISKRKREMCLYSIHDSLVVPATEIDSCKEIFDEEYSSRIGAIPPVKMKLWIP